MTTETWLAFSLFALVSSITPGPNNTMMLASGVNFGFARSVPHMVGITVGFCFMILLMGMGLGAVFERFPVLYTAMRYAGGAYMLYLAWKIFRSRSASDAVQDGAPEVRPMGFTAAAAFQWVNPKAWVMALGAITTYLPAGHSLWQLLALTGVMAVINMPSTGSWALFGSSMRRYLQQPAFLRAFNTVAALALVASLYPLLTH
ncbi:MULTISPECIES: LysE family translocator [unclassified Variovorax]|jgi:threonine/homoserine/homoserine lactone efflux protein|uniref:LysE family translocator n=1 Tax=unclassified Variovorax TaxID=663243 RepID=UPI001BD2A194|nr:MULTISPECIES: LysE family translocator [unclassified Variovorax]